MSKILNLHWMIRNPSDDESDSKETDPAKSSRWKETRQVFKELQAIFPDKFKCKDNSNVPYFDRVLQDPTDVPYRYLAGSL